MININLCQFFRHLLDYSTLAINQFSDIHVTASSLQTEPRRVTDGRPHTLHEKWEKYPLRVAIIVTEATIQSLLANCS